MIIVAASLLCCNGEKNDNPAETPEKQISFKSGGYILYGTLYFPGGRDKSPAVVILAGADRSARGLLRTKLAKEFAKNGVAALVYDSPGTGLSGGNALIQTKKNRIDEALDAVDSLKSIKNIKKNSVGLFGGSEGAQIALLTASVSPKVSFVVAVSGAAGISEMEILRFSAEKRGIKQGFPETEIRKAVLFKQLSFMLLSGKIPKNSGNRMLSEAKKMGGDWAELAEIVILRASGQLKRYNERIFASFKNIVEKVRLNRWITIADPTNSLNMIRYLDSGTFLKLLLSGRYSKENIEDKTVLSKIKCPVLAIWGSDDSFVPPQRSMGLLKKTLNEAAHKDHLLKIFPAASHYLTLGGISSPFAKGYINLVVSWIKKHSK